MVTSGLVEMNLVLILGDACRQVNWYSVSEQIKSVAKLKNSEFLRVLPGHGRPGTFSSSADRQHQIQQLLDAEGYEA